MTVCSGLKMTYKMANSSLLLRVLDANFNRAREGLRVCEEIARFILEDAPLVRRCQRIRYELSTLEKDFPRKKLLSVRDSGKDVGRPAVRREGPSRKRLQDLVMANMKRAEESLRVLEECARLHLPLRARRFGSLRFHAYELEKDLISGLSALRHR